MLADGDRIDLDECVPQAIGIAADGQRLGIAQVGVNIHEADLASEERRRFRAAEYDLRPAAIGDRPVHEPGAVGKVEMLADDSKVMPRLFRREQPGNDRPRHRQEREFETGTRVTWMKEHLGVVVARLEYGIAGNRAVADQMAIEVSGDLRG